jgi:hypothetical protein
MRNGDRVDGKRVNEGWGMRNAVKEILPEDEGILKWR